MDKTVTLSPFKLALRIYRDPERKSIPKMVFEVISLSFLHKGFPGHYFSRYLFKNDRININDYFPGKFLYQIKPYFNNQGDREVLENKLYFNFFYKQFDISLPRILMYNNIRLFNVENSNIEIKSVNDFKIALESVIKKTTTEDSLIVKKTFGSYGGDGVYKISYKDIISNSDKFRHLYSVVSKSGYLFQETIRQHPELNRLNSSSVNSIRFDTFIDKDGNVDIISGYIRMSLNNNHVDNFSSGGCLVSVDLDTGTLREFGYTLFKNGCGKILTEHPVTKVVFKNFKIPFFQQAKAMVKKAAWLSPGLRLVGWDVAIGESEPILIEGNSEYDPSSNDLAEGGYRTNLIFRKVLHEINYSKEN